MRSSSSVTLTVAATLLALALVLVGAASCGGSRDRVAGAPQVASAKSDDGGGAVDASAAPAERPFAGTPTEATDLITAAIDKKAPEVQKCVVEYRTRKNMPHERVTIAMGIDQEGRLLGATLPKGKVDQVLSDCLQRALATAPFPRSHAGVISVTKTYEEIVQ